MRSGSNMGMMTGGILGTDTYNYHAEYVEVLNLDSYVNITQVAHALLWNLRSYIMATLNINSFVATGANNPLNLISEINDRFL